MKKIIFLWFFFGYLIMSTQYYVIGHVIKYIKFYILIFTYSINHFSMLLSMFFKMGLLAAKHPIGWLDCHSFYHY